MAHERADLLTRFVMGLTPQEAALEAVLLFHDASPWDVTKRYAWYALTRSTEATTKVLCDTVRKALKREE